MCEAFLGFGDLSFGKALFLPPRRSPHIIITSKNVERFLLCVAGVHLKCSRALNGLQLVLFFCHLVRETFTGRSSSRAKSRCAYEDLQ